MSEKKLGKGKTSQRPKGVKIQSYDTGILPPPPITAKGRDPDAGVDEGSFFINLEDLKGPGSGPK